MTSATAVEPTSISPGPYLDWAGPAGTVLGQRCDGLCTTGGAPSSDSDHATPNQPTIEDSQAIHKINVSYAPLDPVLPLVFLADKCHVPPGHPRRRPA